MNRFRKEKLEEKIDKLIYIFEEINMIQNNHGAEFIVKFPISVPFGVLEIAGEKFSVYMPETDYAIDNTADAIGRKFTLIVNEKLEG